MSVVEKIVPQQDRPLPSQQRVTIVVPSEAHRFLPELAQMHRARHQIFHEAMGWDVPTANLLEFDQFDAGEATYILYRDPDSGLVTGCARLLPTTAPYMMRDVPSFRAVWGDQPLPNSATVWESSRFGCLSRHGTGYLLCAIWEYALAVGANTIVTLYDVRIERLLRLHGVETTWRSEPASVGNTQAVAAVLPVSWEHLNRIRKASKITGSVVVHGPWTTQAAAA
jgi:acyl homoserine lactone synthase